MALKIAVASSDGKMVNQHFGRAQQFLIFTINPDGSFKCCEIRHNVPPCNGREHGDDQMARAVAMLGDCRAVLASQIGRGARELLLSRGIQPLVLPGFIDATLTRLIETGHLTGKTAYRGDELGQED